MSFNQSFKGERDNLQYELEYKKIKSFLDSNRLDEGHMYITQVQELFGDDISKENQMIIDVLTCILQNRANKVQENLQQISKLDGIIENKLMLFDFTIAKADTFWKAGKQQEALIALENIEGEISRSKHELLSKFTSNLDIIEREVDIQNTKGIVKWYLGDVRNSQNAFQQAYNLASNLQNKYYIANSLNNLGNVFSYQGEILLALDYHKKSLELRKMLPNHTDIACSLANIGEMYQYLGKYDLSLEFYKQAQSIFESLDSYIFLAQLYHDLLNVYVIKNNLQEAQALDMEKICSFIRIFC
jgi:tetratricopeptide (TPR) repeat protein